MGKVEQGKKVKAAYRVVRKRRIRVENGTVKKGSKEEKGRVV